MIEIPTKYDPLVTEDKWYKYWLDNCFFNSVPDSREPYTNVIPPPNVTGVLHMGHMLNNTIQDVLVRRARMLGKNSCWVPGTDHASIATEAKVVGMLKEKGIDKKSLTREEFLNYAWEWKEKHGGIILEQLKKLGASCDWSRTKFTLDKELSESVIDVFIHLHNKGLIYKGIRMVNWDPSAKTAVSDEEVIYKEVQSKLYYIRYKIEGNDEWLTIATTRPETILGDTAVCVNPNDERYKHLKNTKIIIPLVERPVPIIFDEYVEMEFGTGALKVTPAHDVNDYELGFKHNLESINIFNDDATIKEYDSTSKHVSYIGKDRFEVRKLIVEELTAKGHIVKIEDYTNNIGISERTESVIEPRMSMQWFLKMEELVKPALENVMNDNIKIYPAKFKNTYKHWMENVKDWCISRQLWWGHRIPAYYLPTGEIIIAKSKEEALTIAKEKYNTVLTDIRQEDDVLDTWFSSWLWPISVFDGIRNPNNADIKYYYPTDDLVTAPEILFFWVARMIIAGYEFRGKMPFHNVYLTGIVRDKLGRKMSKSLGNSPEPISLIKQYGADGVRVGMLLCSPAGGDLLFDECLVEQGRNFANKIWNVFRLIKTWEIDETIPQPEASKVAIEWFNSKLNNTIETINCQFDSFRISETLMTVYRLFWDDFSSWYLEIIKPEYQKPIDKVTIEASIEFFEKGLKLLHPFMPFITEEIWHLIKERGAKESITISPLPKAGEYNVKLIENFEQTKEIITFIRSIRKDKNIPLRDKIDLYVKDDKGFSLEKLDSVIIKLCNLTEIKEVEDKQENAFSFIVKTSEYFIPYSKDVDFTEEINKLNKELEYCKGFLCSVERKLTNEKFVNSAPENVVNVERAKKQDAEIKIKALEEQIGSLKAKVN